MFALKSVHYNKRVTAMTPSHANAVSVQETRAAIFNHSTIQPSDQESKQERQLNKTC